MTNHNLTVGQTLLYVPDDKRWSSENEVVVTKIGRLYATVVYATGSLSFRVKLETMRVADAHQTPAGRCYLSREEWQAAEAAKAMWDKLNRAIRFQYKPLVDADKIAEGAKLLGFDLEEYE